MKNQSPDELLTKLEALGNDVYNFKDCFNNINGKPHVIYCTEKPAEMLIRDIVSRDMAVIRSYGTEYTFIKTRPNNIIVFIGPIYPYSSPCMI